MAGPPVPRFLREEAIRFYRDRRFRRVWIPHGGLEPRATQLLELLEDAPTQGLDSARYGADSLRALASGRTAGPGAGLRDLEAVEARFALAFFRYAADLSMGQADGGLLHVTWDLPRRQVDLPEVLGTLLAEGRPLRDLPARLAPSNPRYAQLRESLRRYRDLAAEGPWPKVPEGPTLETGEPADSIRVERLRERLVREGYPPVPEPPGVYSDSLASVVALFQDAHGLVPDGKVGRHTRAALNRTLEECVRAIELNLERWRWIEGSEAPDRVEVNIPALRLTLYRDGQPAERMRVVVGRDEWETPIFSDTLRYIDVNPYWNVPRTIAAHTILAKVREDSTYLVSRDFEIYSDWSREATLVDPESIDWSRYSETDFPFRLRQRPGNVNALGRMKFMFPNRYHVYLHDTPDVRYFHKDARSVSHGCIRVERPYDLAAFLLAPDSTWTRTRLQEVVDSEKPRIVGLVRPLPVDLVYRTVEVLPSGRTAFYEDIYAVDSLLDDYLRGRPLPPRPPRRADGTGRANSD